MLRNRKIQIHPVIIVTKYSIAKTAARCPSMYLPYSDPARLYPPYISRATRLTV